MNKPSPCILAIDLHKASFGFAVFQDGTLLDWGVRRRTQKGKPGLIRLARKQFLFLIRLWQPLRIILRQTRRLPVESALLATIRDIASDADIPLRNVKHRDFARSFGGLKLTQRALARAVSEYFPALSFQVSPKRDITRNQPYQLSILLAVALGYAYAHRKETAAACDEMAAGGSS